MTTSYKVNTKSATVILDDIILVEQDGMGTRFYKAGSEEGSRELVAGFPSLTTYYPTDTEKTSEEE